MITAAIHGETISPRARVPIDALGALASEVAARIGEMNEIRLNAGTDFIVRLASMASIDRGSFATVVSCLHGDTSSLTDSYSERGDSVGRKKQTVHYRTLRQIESIAPLFPEVAAILSTLRLSVKHHEDPTTTAQVIRDACE
jgi:hypothetical protein